MSRTAILWINANCLKLPFLSVGFSQSGVPQGLLMQLVRWPGGNWVQWRVPSPSGHDTLTVHIWCPAVIYRVLRSLLNLMGHIYPQRARTKFSVQCAKQ